MSQINRDQLKKMMDENVATIVEVLDAASYTKFHIPTAVNVPLEENFDDQIVKMLPDREHPVVLYCMDIDCPASGKAEERMQALGYSHVYHYKGGKSEWRSSGLPIQ